MFCRGYRFVEGGRKFDAVAGEEIGARGEQLDGAVDRHTILLAAPGSHRPDRGMEVERGEIEEFSMNVFNGRKRLFCTASPSHGVLMATISNSELTARRIGNHPVVQFGQLQQFEVLA